MSRSVKIRELKAPPNDLSAFDPGAYFSDLEFYETDEPLTEDDRDALAQLVHLLAFFALNANSTQWNGSKVEQASTAYRALESHFGQLHGWSEITTDEGVYYKDLAVLLMGHYPPKQKR